MASVGVASEIPKCDPMLVDKLPGVINEMKIKDEKVEKEIEAAVVDGNGTETGHITVTTIGGKNGQPKQVNPGTHQLKICDFGSAKVLVKGEPNISYICSRYYRVRMHVQS